MGDWQSTEELRQRARDSCRRLRGLYNDDELLEAKALVGNLRDWREYELMGQLAEAVSRVDPKDVRNRRLYAQYLIETGKAPRRSTCSSRWADGWTARTPNLPRPRVCWAAPTNRYSATPATRPAPPHATRSSRRSPCTGHRSNSMRVVIAGMESTCWPC